MFPCRPLCEMPFCFLARPSPSGLLTTLAPVVVATSRPDVLGLVPLGQVRLLTNHSPIRTARTTLVPLPAVGRSRHADDPRANRRKVFRTLAAIEGNEARRSVTPDGAAEIVLLDAERVPSDEDRRPSLLVVPEPALVAPPVVKVHQTASRVLALPTRQN